MISPIVNAILKILVTIIGLSIIPLILFKIISHNIGFYLLVGLMLFSMIMAILEYIGIIDNSIDKMEI